ncbi:DUF732 domain-containing protein [Antrihabitans sp. YC2-6]|uniref:DUF732 domain-containing protein n=1 Tax=Antrihabitans sp. YC2-6 TaxID=2799498 RepID=UPI0018F3930F|nr:DUF732 domain-containing protein [Antrihabitans sp. YC2-6]MBJ8345445.1 DUF732 domain-containing protein [Antrihabitans sp. YC2-6]
MARLCTCIVALTVVLTAGCSAGESTESSTTAAKPTSAAAASTDQASVTTAAETTPLPPGGGTPEEQFIAAVRAGGIPIRNDEGLIGTAQRMCDALTAGESVDATAQLGIEEHPWNPDQAKTAVQLAGTLLCPENAGKVAN